MAAAVPRTRYSFTIRAALGLIVILLLLIGYLFRDHISNAGHAGGFVGGALFALVVRPADFDQP